MPSKLLKIGVTTAFSSEVGARLVTRESELKLLSLNVDLLLRVHIFVYRLLEQFGIGLLWSL